MSGDLADMRKLGVWDFWWDEKVGCLGFLLGCLGYLLGGLDPPESSRAQSPRASGLPRGWRIVAGTGRLAPCRYIFRRLVAKWKRDVVDDNSGRARDQPFIGGQSLRFSRIL